MSDLFELLSYEAVNVKVDVPVVISINGTMTICAEVDSSQDYAPYIAPRYTRLLNASLVDGQNTAGEISLRVPRPPVSSAVSLSGGPNRRWLVTIGTTAVTGEEVGWDQWLDYNSYTNCGSWDPRLVSSLKQRYPMVADERAYFHLINVRFHSSQITTALGESIYVPTSEVCCLGSRG